MTTRFALRCASESAGTIPIPNLCIGTWAWGDSSTWDNASAAAVANLDDAWRTLAKHNLYFIDTAEVYGRGESERIIARLRGNPALTSSPTSSEAGAGFNSKLVIASKYLPIPWPITRLLRPTTAMLDLYQIHGPIHFANSIESMAAGLAKCVEEGLTRAVGVSNYSRDEMVRMDDALRAKGYRLASNQVEFSLLRSRPATTDGLLEECRKRGIVLLAYSPLGMGRLTGKYSRSNPPPSGRRFGNVGFEELAKLVDVMKEVAGRHGVSVSAVALKWVMQMGAVPLGGVKNAKQAEENARAASDEWTLTDEEMEELSKFAQEGTKSWVWQHG
ncbi:NADP-dependent oxidoreductase domain-containing protein [Coniella lustricola]|uniref:NADP-dependent oxidoreductase domain-containing protein n=1 Tax=Coniella lustricola TaxID=2025994 RepID=A0A2T3AJW5_9PEZI|nr:NADP-dependent oxidoreductase domain-containing protein [Coniella lustricola]